MFSALTVIVSSIAAKVSVHIITVSTASNTHSLSSCISLLYASGKPFITVSMVIKSPKTLPDLPRTSSAMSGFFFCGIIDEPVENASSSSMNLNSQLHQRIISSEKRERCTIMIEIADSSSIIKSRSDTPSRLLVVTPFRFSFSATISRFNGYVVPASAPEPSGDIAMRFLQSQRRSKSRESIDAYAIK